MQTKKSGSACGLIAGIVALIFLVAIIAGQLIAGTAIEAQKAACGVLQAGLSQTNRAPETASPETQAKCVSLVITTEPLTRLMAVFFSIVATIIFLGFCFVGFSTYAFFSGRPKASL